MRATTKLLSRFVSSAPLTTAPNTKKLMAEQSRTVSLAIFSGGTASNSFCRELMSLTEHVSYILPVSDDGGSTAEIIRVLGGPAIGDIRSRLVRLSDGTTEETKAVLKLLHYRLQSTPTVSTTTTHAHDGSHQSHGHVGSGVGGLAAQSAALEWLQILDGSHQLWHGISDPYKDIIRSFLVHFNTEILVRAKKGFNYSNGSVGNFFFTGARLFFGSLEAAIFLFSSIARIPQGTHVVPIIDTTFDRCTIGATLRNGQVIIGQNEISHPAAAGDNHVVNKDVVADLPSPIDRIFYVNREGKETAPTLNQRVLTTLESRKTVVYSIGSLYTSIIPCLVLPGMGKAISTHPGRKVLLLNGTADRETKGMTAADFVLAVTKALNTSLHPDPPLPPSHYVTHIIHMEGGDISLDASAIDTMGINRVKVVSTGDVAQLFPAEELAKILSETAAH